jgi:hypothetical protein
MEAQTKTSAGRTEYLALFEGDARKIEAALKVAHEIRKFEIELYWKRATYFWAILAVAFAGYFTAQNANNTFGTILIGNIGLILGVAWYLVNRGGSGWQQNWELHVDLLEDEITGPLYKTLINRKQYSVWDLAGPYPFSPTRVNAIVSMFIAAVWVPLMLRANVALFMDENTSQIDCILALAVGICTLLIVALLFQSGKARRLTSNRKIEARTRLYE